MADRAERSRLFSEGVFGLFWGECSLFSGDVDRCFFDMDGFNFPHFIIFILFVNIHFLFPNNLSCVVVTYRLNSLGFVSD